MICMQFVLVRLSETCRKGQLKIRAFCDISSVEPCGGYTTIYGVILLIVMTPC